jgi:hypothetical protein
VIAETHGRGFVAPVLPTLAPLRTLIRLALALRPVLLGAMLARSMLTRLVFTWRMFTRGMLTRLVLLGAKFSIRLGRRPRLALMMLAELRRRNGLCGHAVALPLNGERLTAPASS